MLIIVRLSPSVRFRKFLSEYINLSKNVFIIIIIIIIIIINVD